MLNQLLGVTISSIPDEEGQVIIEVADYLTTAAAAELIEEPSSDA